MSRSVLSEVEQSIAVQLGLDADAMRRGFCLSKEQWDAAAPAETRDLLSGVPLQSAVLTDAQKTIAAQLGLDPRAYAEALRTT